MTELLLASLSFVIGIIVGVTGIGGASLITPMLVLLFNIPPSVAVSSDVVAATLMKIIGGIKHWQQRTLDGEIVKWLALGSVPGSLIGVTLLHFLRQWEIFDQERFLLRLIGIMILMVTLLAIADCLSLKLNPQRQFILLPKLDLSTQIGRIQSIILGAILGCLVGLTSVASGSFFLLALVSFFQIDSHKLVGTDISQASILMTFTSLGHLSLGTVDWALVLPIWCGSVPGVLIGARLCRNIPQYLLRPLVYGLLIMVSFKLVYPV